MIATTAKHGRTPQDCANLVSHLLHEENEVIEILEIGNSVALDLEGVVRDMQIQQAASRALCAFHHISVNPFLKCSNTQLLDAANRLRSEFDPDGMRPYIIIRHRKPRSDASATDSSSRDLRESDAYASDSHAHLVLGNVTNGKALDDHLSKIRSEVVCRIWEFSNGENPVASRHHKKILAILEKRGRHDVRNWLIEKFGEDPEKPLSAMSSNSRQRAKRVGIKLPQAKATIVNIWDQTQEISAFRRALSEAGYFIATGDKANVWVVFDGDQNLIGSLDRLLRKKRHEIAQLMEAKNDTGTQIESANIATNSGSRKEAARSVDRDIPATLETNAIAGITGGAGPDGLRPDLAYSAISGNTGPTGRAPDQRSQPDRSKTRCNTRFEYNRSLGRLRQLGRLIGMSAILTSQYKERLENTASGSNLTWTGQVDIWGIPISPPQKFQP